MFRVVLNEKVKDLLLLLERTFSLSFYALSISLAIHVLGELTWTSAINYLSCKYVYARSTNVLVRGITCMVMCRLLEAYKISLPTAVTFLMHRGKPTSRYRFLSIAITSAIITEIGITIWDVIRLTNEKPFTFLEQMPAAVVMVALYCFLGLGLQTITLKPRVAIVLLSLLPDVIQIILFISFSWIAGKFLLATTTGKILIRFGLPAFFLLLNSGNQWISRYIIRISDSDVECQHSSKDTDVLRYLVYPRTVALLLNQSTICTVMSCFLTLRVSFFPLFSLFFHAPLKNLHVYIFLIDFYRCQILLV
jgi:hypothetical protein